MTSIGILRTAFLAGLVAAVSHAPCAQAALYKCTGADGKVAYQDAPCPTNAAEQALQAKKPPAPAASAKKAPAGTNTASPPKAGTAAGAKAAQSFDVKVAPAYGKATDSASTAQPAADAAKVAAPGK